MAKGLELPLVLLHDGRRDERYAAKAALGLVIGQDRCNDSEPFAPLGVFEEALRKALADPRINVVSL